MNPLSTDQLRENSPFIDDLDIDGMVHVITARSPLSRGKILSVSLPHLPRDYASISAEDIAGANELRVLGFSMPLLADKEVRYAGEPVVLLAGPKLEKLEELIGQVKIDIEERPPYFNYETFSSDQVLKKRIIKLGNPEEAFFAADKVLEGSYRTGCQAHMYSECQGAFVYFDYDKMIVRSSTQWPFHVRDTIAGALDIEDSDIIIRPSAVGTHLDGKLWYPSLVAAHAALAAVICRKPAKLLYSRKEDFLFSPKRAPSCITHKTALDAEGNIIGMDIQVIANLGAYGPFAEEILDRMCIGSTGAYSCQNVRLEAYAVSTNLPPMGAFSGLGLSQSFFAMETHSSKISELYLCDPSEWKRKNILKKGDPIITGERLKDKVPLEEITAKLLSASDYQRKFAAYELMKKRRSGRGDHPLRGIGYSFGYQGNGFLGKAEEGKTYSVELRLDKDLKLSISTSAVATSQSTLSIWKNLAAEMLGLDEKNVSLSENGTDQVPDSGPSTLSRNITVITKLVERCCRAIQKSRFRDPLPIKVRRNYKISETVSWDSSRFAGYPFAFLSWAGAVVEVETDPLSLEPLVRGVWMAVDGGRIISKKKAQGALESGCLSALSWASREKIEFSEGKIPESSYYRYRIPSSADSPPLKIDIIESEGKGPVKGLGELPFICIPSAYAIAVSQAMGISFDELPALPDRAIEQGEEQ